MIFFIKTLSAGYNYAITTISNNKECNDDINDKNILQIAKQNMRDAAAKQLAWDEARMQQAYAVGGETYIPLKRVEPGGQAKSLNDVWQNSLSGLINPTYGGNLPLAAWSTVGDLIDCGMQQVAHQISTVEGGSQTLAVVGYIPNKLIATVKDFSKDIAKKYLPKEYYQNLSEFYHGLPDNTKVTLNLFTDGLILQGAGSALKVGLTSPVPAAIQHIPHKPGISTTPSAMLAFEGGSSNPLFAIKGTTSGIGEISATSGAGKISVDTGATLGENAIKPSSVLSKVEIPKFSAIEKISEMEPWMSQKSNLSTKQLQLMDGIETYGKNPGNIYPHKKTGALHVDTELPGGEQAARNMFKNLTGQEPSLNILIQELPDGTKVIFRKLGDSGHPKLEIDCRSTKANTYEKITFKE